MSVKLAEEAVLLESVFLAMEHEHLWAAQNPSFKRPVHVFLASVEASVSGTHQLSTASPLTRTPPTPPAPTVLAASFVRCGTNQRMPLKAAVEGLFLPMIHKYKSLLPALQWRAVCMRVMHMYHTLAAAIKHTQSASDTPKPRQQPVGGSMHRSDTEGSEHARGGSRQMSPHGLMNAVHAMIQMVLCMLYEALHGSTPDMVCSALFCTDSVRLNCFS